MTTRKDKQKAPKRSLFHVLPFMQCAETNNEREEKIGIWRAIGRISPLSLGLLFLVMMFCYGVLIFYGPIRRIIGLIFLMFTEW